ncbi:PspC domain-containing protein [Microbacterium gilvum]|uniref:Phage shock protein PspC N-terminal domain-containing protein n=1 Tax=Microbacterium gilvum TaxID=1336204 RepID=A0ABP9AG16_9MICO
MTEREPTTAPPPAAPGGGFAPRGDAPRVGRGFFDWVRSLGLVRADGWIGGVCAAIARRTGADPVIVRGIFVVAAVLGFPALWLYALGWALLPDERGEIAIRLRTGSGPALVGVAIMVAFGAVASWASATLMEDLLQLAYPGRIVWTAIEASLWIAVLGAVVAFALWLVRREPAAGARPPAPGRVVLVVVLCVAVAVPVLALGFGVVAPFVFGYGSPVGALAAAAFCVAAVGFAVWAGRRILGGAALVPPAAPSASVPPSPPPAAPPVQPPLDGDFDGWRRQHDEWRAQHDAWRAQQADAERAARDADRAQRQAAAHAFAQDAARIRAARRAARPRIPLAYGASVVGLALVVGAATALVVMKNEAWPGDEARILGAVSGALFAGALVAALGMVVAGILRRRSGVLAFAAVVALVAGASTALGANSVFGMNSWQSVAIGDGDHEIAQAFGTVDLGLTSEGDGAGTAVVERRGGFTQVTVPSDVDADIRIDADPSTYISVLRQDEATGQIVDEEVLSADDGVYAWHHDGVDGTTARRTVDITQTEGGQITIWVIAPVEQESEPTPTATPEPTETTEETQR